jgi:peptidoglycan/LPS O-acetylase OafA/YrhL
MSERNPKVTARNDGLQVARAVGCLSVLVGHAAYMAGIISGGELPTWIPRIFSPFGVYLFFVLSGYVMGLVFRSDANPTQPHSWRTARCASIRRIGPRLRSTAPPPTGSRNPCRRSTFWRCCSRLLQQPRRI